MSTTGWICVGIVCYANVVMIAMAICRHWKEQDQQMGVRE